MGLTLEADRVKRPKNPSESRRLVLDALTFQDMSGKHYSRIAEFQGDRDVRWTYAGGDPHGGLLLKPDVKDWSRKVDLSGFHGSVALRLRLLNEKNEPEPVHDIEKEKMQEPTKEVTKTIVLDDTPPEVTRLEPVSSSIVRGKPFVVQARGIDESGIKDVVFVVGKFPANAPLPLDAIARPGKQIKEGSSTWAAELVVP
jgi:hypothetical protein